VSKGREAVEQLPLALGRKTPAGPVGLLDQLNESVEGSVQR